ncbi:hypothetical protein EC988_004008 [Linderina pennispora]|nr:hypothetical protein EC988_004008 [Linderina pennispora]
MANPTLVSDCSAVPYCTKTGTALGYNEPFTVYWNNKYSPLNTEQRVTISVFSIYDFTTPLYTKDVSNQNGFATLTPDASWYSRYTGADNSVGEKQQVFFAVYLEGNDVPSSDSMLSLFITATDSQYTEIKSILAAASASAEAATMSRSSAKLSPSLSDFASATATDNKSDVDESIMLASSSESLESALASLSSEESEMSSLLSDVAEPSSTSNATLPIDTHKKSGLSGGAIAGIAVGSVAGIALIALLLLLLLRRNRKSKAVLEKGSAGIGPSPSGDSLAGAAAAGAAAGAAGLGIVTGAARRQDKGPNRSPSDTPLLTFAGKPNNSFNSREDSLSEHQVSPGVFQPINLDTPRIYANVPKSTRTNKDSGPILTADDALQLGNVFRDALRKPPPVSEDGNSNSHGHRESMMLAEDDDDELSEEEMDPGWRERVASERMQRELEQEASVIRTVALRAHGSDYSSSRPETSQSTSSSHRMPHSPIGSTTDKTFST